MNKYICLIFTFSLACSASLAQNNEENFRFTYKPMAGSYEIYGGELDDPRPADAESTNIAIKIQGAAARNIFNSLGKDIKNACVSEAGERVRMKKDMACFFSKKEGYSCFVGFDLKTGKSKAGIIC